MDIARRRQSLYDVAKLHLTTTMDFWQNSTRFLVWQLSLGQKLAILEDNLKNENNPKNYDKLKNKGELKNEDEP